MADLWLLFQYAWHGSNNLYSAIYNNVTNDAEILKFLVIVVISAGIFAYCTLCLVCFFSSYAAVEPQKKCVTTFGT